MKKSLLLAAAIAAVTPAFAVTDGSTYATIDGITCQSKWMDSRASNMFGFNSLPFISTTKARTAAIYTPADGGESKVIVGWSQTIANGETSDDYATIVFINFSNGTLEKSVQCTLNGEPIKGLLCANQVGCDAFGHIWFAGYIANLITGEGADAKSNNYRIYKLDNLETGACSVAADLQLPTDEAENNGRIDYCSIDGDITREKAPCTVMAATNGGINSVIGWTCQQNSSEWGPKLNGNSYFSGHPDDTYPAGQTTWGTAPTLTIVGSDEYTADLFYVDGFTTCPTLYDNELAMLESFDKAPDLAPKPGTNGVSEFTLGAKNFIVYSISQYDVTPGCQARIAELGEGQTMEGMKSYWEIPEKGLGEVSDGGTRYHGLNTRKYVDANGKEGVYLLDFKCFNGIGVYAVAEEGWVDPNLGGVNDVIADEDVNAPVEYFNLQGVSVNADNLTPGLYLTRQGKTVKKVVVK